MTAEQALRSVADQEHCSIADSFGTLGLESEMDLLNPGTMVAPAAAGRATHADAGPLETDEVGRHPCGVDGST